MWADSNKHFFQKFDECFEYKPANINSAFFDLIRHNHYKIKSAKSKTPRFTEIVNGKAVDRFVSIDYTCRNVFEIYTGNNILVKKVDDFDLDTKYINGHFNKNYDPNKKSILNQLKMSVEKEVVLYNKDPKNRRGAQ